MAMLFILCACWQWRSARSYWPSACWQRSPTRCKMDAFACSKCTTCCSDASCDCRLWSCGDGCVLTARSRIASRSPSSAALLELSCESRWISACRGGSVVVSSCWIVASRLGLSCSHRSSLALARAILPSVPPRNQSWGWRTVFPKNQFVDTSSMRSTCSLAYETFLARAARVPVSSPDAALNLPWAEDSAAATPPSAEDCCASSS
mmetsp:Transcript_28413/g.91022  ORF Transcript_28413/g.91022 Transcript_28413/m.91022 type:complete len:206 (-) Transcript_28413:60-677(-)